MEIKEIRFDGKIPSIAYTDFSAIYLSQFLYGEELSTARKHELSHIWLQHQIRLQNLKKRLENVDLRIWNIAADLEIAKYIYSDEDNHNITKPRSFLHGGINTAKVKEFAGEYAEDFYEELLSKKQDNYSSFDGEGNIFNDTDGDDGEVSLPDIVKEAINKAIQDEENVHQRKISEQLQEAIHNFKPPKPSLASEIDSLFGRNKIVRKKSYRRPSRRESQFLLAGRASVKKSAKVTIYVDRSGSFDESKTEFATNKLSEMLRKYRSKIDKDVIYFNDTLMNDDPLKGLGGTNYKAVYDDIVRNNAELSIVITDNDSCEDTVKPTTQKVIVVPVGCASTLFAQKIRAKEIT
jgi:predicted metal-dependent peptidase